MPERVLGGRSQRRRRFQPRKGFLCNEFDPAVTIPRMKRPSHYVRPILAPLLLLGMPAVGQEPKTFFGNLHSHTAYSDGTGRTGETFSCSIRMKTVSQNDIPE